MDISFQLYSARDHGAWPDTLRLLAHTGFTRVEGFGGLFDDPDALADMLAQNGLSMPSGHISPLAKLEQDWAQVRDAAQKIGMTRLFCPAPDEALRSGADSAAWIDVARRLEQVALRARADGLRFGWHNHHWEFLPLADGAAPMALLLEHAPHLEWEMDVAWVSRAGADPFAWIAEHGTRITTAHVKDIAPKGSCLDEDGWADLGQGVMDWPALVDALRSGGTDLFVLEHDKPSDAARFARRSLAALQEM